MLLAVAAVLGLVSQVPASPSAATATGRVLDLSTRAPLVQAKVTLLPSAEQRRATPFVRPISVLTDADGRFVLTGIAPGEHTVQVTSAGGEFALSSVLQGNYLLVAVPPIVLSRDPSPEARGRRGHSYTRGGTRPETARGSVATELVDGTTRQFRDELATTVPVDVTGGSVFDVRLVVKRP